MTRRDLVLFPLKGGEDIFVHHTAIQSEGSGLLKKETMLSLKLYKAIKVTKLRMSKEYKAFKSVAIYFNLNPNILNRMLGFFVELHSTA
jgi:hypothetical protein